MVYASEVYKWFKELAAHNRIEFVCNLMKLCVPSELRFISILLEDMNNKDYPSLRDTEERCNSPSEFSQYTHVQLNSEHVHKLCLTLSLLKPTNQILAQMIYEILRIHFKYIHKCLVKHSDIKADIMLLYALASFHPAFAFNCRHKLAEYFTTLLEIYNDDTCESTDCNNSALRESIFEPSQLPISVTEVIIEKNDAQIIIELVSQQDQQRNVMNKQCHYSEIKHNVCNIFSEDHEFYRTVVTLMKNGSFTSKNISDFVTKIIAFAYIDSSEEAKSIIDFFNKLPSGNYYHKPPQFFQTAYIDEDCKEMKSNCVPNVFQEPLNDTDGQSFFPTSDQQDDSVFCSPDNTKCTPTILSSRDNQCCVKNSSTLSLQSDNISQNPKEISPKKGTQKSESDTELPINSNRYPVNIVNLQYPYFQYYIPNCHIYPQSKGSTSLSSLSNIHDSSSSSCDGANNSVTVTTQCLPATTFIPYNIHQTSFTPVQLFCHPINPCFRSSESYPFSLANVVNRPK